MSHPRRLLALASTAVAFAAADTYVVVLALPEMMSAAGLSVEQLQRAAPIISGFLLGYVAMLPLIGRIADLRGREPVLIGSLVVFALGSMITAASYDLPSLVAGRFLQGMGGGGLVPVTLALVADHYPPERRGVPLGAVGAVQELGSVLGPLFGALVLAVGGWRDIFWINLTVGVLLAAGVLALTRDRRAGGPGRTLTADPIGLALAAATLAVALVVMRQPDALVTSVTWGGLLVPFGTATSPWLSPAGLGAAALGLALLAWSLLRGEASLIDLRGWSRTARSADLLGAALLALALGGVILAFASADPEVQVFAPAGPWLLTGSAIATAAFTLHQRRARVPLVPRGCFAARPAWGSVLVSFLVGAALIAALVDIPVFARITVYGDSQLHAALVLVEFLVALPIGALLGGLALHRLPAGVLTALGMVLTAGGFIAMANWGPDALHHPSSSLVLAATGLGFGLALAPVNAALLASTRTAVHGIASALLVVARMVGMLVGISALTTLGLRRYYEVAATVPPPREVCGGASRCAAYSDLLQEAGVAQLHTIFLGAAVSAGVAAAAALVLLAGARTRQTSAGAVFQAAG